MLRLVFSEAVLIKSNGLHLIVVKLFLIVVKLSRKIFLKRIVAGKERKGKIVVMEYFL